MIGYLVILSMRSWIRQLDWQHPIPFYLQTLRYVPTSFRIRNNLALEYQRNGQYTKAIEEYSKAIELNPTLPNPYNNLGNLYMSLGQYHEAERNYLHAVELNKSFFYAYQGLIHLYQQTGEEEKLKQIQSDIKNLLSEE